MPAEKRRKAKTPEDVPDLGDPDRKRVLNVLAQRRYRQRRKEKIAALEAQAKSQSSPESSYQLQDRGIQLDPSSGSSATPDSILEEPGSVEEVFRNTDDLSFPMLDFNQDPLDLTLFQDFNLTNLPSPIPSSPLSPNVLSQPKPVPSSPILNFPLTPDGALLNIPILSALRAFGTIATTLNLVNHIYDPFYLHTLPPTPHPSLPLNLHPTPAQIAIPHHPTLDILPWPSVREKLICVLSLPSLLRPPIAQEDDGDGQGKAVIQIVQDLDDFNDGVRVHGNSTQWGEGNEFVEDAWEIGEAFFRNWWWCLDGRVVEIANRRRRERGVRALTMKR